MAQVREDDQQQRYLRELLDGLNVSRDGDHNTSGSSVAAGDHAAADPKPSTPPAADLPKILAAWEDSARFKPAPLAEMHLRSAMPNQPKSGPGSANTSTTASPWSVNGASNRGGGFSVEAVPSPTAAAAPQRTNSGRGSFDTDSPSSASWARGSKKLDQSSRDPMLAPPSPSSPSSATFVPPAHGSMLTQSQSTLASLPLGMPPPALFAPFQCKSESVAVLNLEAKTTQRQLLNIFFPMGATDAVVFATMTPNQRKNGVVIFTSRDAAIMAAEKIDNFVPHGQSQPLTCVYLPKGDQERTQKLYDDMVQRQQHELASGMGRPADSLRSTPSHTDSSADEAALDDSNVADGDGAPKPMDGANLGSFQVSGSSSVNESRSRPMTPKVQTPSVRSTNSSMLDNSQCSQPATQRSIGTPPPTPNRSQRVDEVQPSSRPTTRAHNITHLLSSRASATDIYPVLTAAVIGQPAHLIQAAVDATANGVANLLVSVEQQRTGLRVVANLIKMLSEDNEQTMKATFQEPLCRIVMSTLLNADEDPSSRSVCGVACGYLFDHEFIGGNPFAMARKLMGRATADPAIVDALVSLTSSWSSRHSDRQISDEEKAVEADFRTLVHEFYESEGRDGPINTTSDVNLSVSTAGGTPPASADTSLVMESGRSANTSAAAASTPNTSMTVTAAPFIPGTGWAGASSTRGTTPNSQSASRNASLLSDSSVAPSSRPMPSSTAGITTTMIAPGVAATATHNHATAAFNNPPSGAAASSASVIRETTLQKDLLQATVYITRIPHGVREEKLREMFLEFGGEYNKVRLYDDPQNASRGRGAFCFVEFVAPQAARSLIRSLNNFQMGDHTLLVSYARSAIHDQDPRDAVFSPDLGKVRECMFGLGGQSAAANRGHKLNAGALSFSPPLNASVGSGNSSISISATSNHVDPAWH